MPTYSIETGTPSSLSGAHDLSGAAGLHPCLFVAVTVIPASSGQSYTAYPSRALTYGPGSTPMVLLGVTDCHGSPVNGWVELYALINPPVGAYSMAYNAGAAVKSIVMESISHTGVAQVTPGSPAVNNVAGTTADMFVVSAAGKRVLAAFACAAAITGVTGGDARLNHSSAVTGNAKNLLLADAAGASVVHLTAATASSANWGVVACSVDAVTPATADHQALTDGLHQGLTGIAATGASSADVQAAAATVQSTAQSAAAQLSDATTTALTSGALGTTDFGRAMAAAMGSWRGSLLGSPTADASAADYAAAQAITAAGQALQAQTISAIQAQLTNFYGGSGTAGTTVTQTFTSDSVLPSGFSTTSTIAKASAKSTTILATDTQTVSGVWSTADNKARYLFLRANTGFTTYVYVKLATGTNASELGCVVSGTKTVFGTFTLPGAGMTANQAYKCSAVSYTYTVTGPNGLSYSYTDGSHVSLQGSLYRFGGFGHDGTSYGTSVVDATGNYTFPSWIATGCPVDVVAIAGSGGGEVGTPSSYAVADTDFVTGLPRYFGHGGGKGAFSGAALIYGTDITGGTTTLACTIGAGGTGGTIGTPTGGNGTGTSVVVPGHATITGTGGSGGGAGGSTTTGGQDAGTSTLDGLTYTGGPAQTGYGAAGNIPGGGGGPGWTEYYGGAVSVHNAGPGAAGRAWITPYALLLPAKLASFTFYDSGPTTGPQTAYVATSETTASTSFTDLATTTDTVTVNIGASGIAVVFISAGMSCNTNGSRGFMSFALSGANTYTPSSAGPDFKYTIAVNGFEGNSTPGAAFIVPGLSPGATTFKAKYMTGTGSSSTFDSRQISVTPL